MERKPSWLKVRLSLDGEYQKTEEIIKKFKLHTVCKEADCPNRGACFAEGTATFMILGDLCTRNCRFCAVGKGPTRPLDPSEPSRVAEAVQRMGLSYAVITSVTRDDLPDGGAQAFAEVIRAIRELSPKTLIEVLTPDFQGNMDSLEMVAEARPDVFNHNIETVERLYPTVRPQANYGRSLRVLAEMKRLLPTVKTKSGLMVGLGEKQAEVQTVMEDLRAASCDLLTIGQYLSPSKNHLPVEEYITPEQFKEYERRGLDLGFIGVASGPLVRSSYHAKKLYQEGA